VDQLVLVTAVQPPPNRGLLDRFIVLAEAEGIDVLLVLNKVDLGGAALDQARHTLAPYAAAGYRIHELSVSRGDGLAELRAGLAAAPGRISVLAGHSGVGKSSLMNELVPGAALPTDELSRSRRGFRGRHMTTRRTCHLLPVAPAPPRTPAPAPGRRPGAGANWPADCAMVVDTAGVRSFSLVGIAQSTLVDGFREFREISSGCRFRDCKHLHEPGCAVREAVGATGSDAAVDAYRYDSYLLRWILMHIYDISHLSLGLNCA